MAPARSRCTRGFGDYVSNKRVSVALVSLAFIRLDIHQLMDETVPASIRNRPPLAVGKALTETEALKKLETMVSTNQIHKSYIGMGYYNTITPPPILRNIIQNPGWYTPYTPYQAEISQGRMESLVNYQTMISDLTGMKIAQASLLVSSHLDFYDTAHVKRDFYDACTYVLPLIETRIVSSLWRTHAWALACRGMFNTLYASAYFLDS